MCVDARERARACVCIRARVCAFVCLCWDSVCVCASVCVCVCVCVFWDDGADSVGECVCSCVCACVRACVCVCVELLIKSYDRETRIHPTTLFVSEKKKKSGLLCDFGERGGGIAVETRSKGDTNYTRSGGSKRGKGHKMHVDPAVPIKTGNFLGFLTKNDPILSRG